MGAVLAPKQDDGSVRPIAYASRTLQKHEQNYAVAELEAMGVVWAVRHFRHYLYGYHCDVYTNHEALKSLLNTPHPSGKLARWGLALQEIDLSIFYRPGKKNVLADALSRAPIQGEDMMLVPEENLVAAVASPEFSAKSGEGRLCERQCLDPGLRQIMLYLQSTTLPTDEKEARELALTAQQYVLLDGVLLFIGKDQALKVIPTKQERKKPFDEVHGGAFGGHLHDAKIHGELSKKYWWPGMRGDIIRWCQACFVCASRQVGQAVRPPLTPIPVAGRWMSMYSISQSPQQAINKL